MLQKTDIRDSDEKVVEIEMERLRTFTNHPFKVIGDSQMIELQDSIKKYGVLNQSVIFCGQFNTCPSVPLPTPAFALV